MDCPSCGSRVSRVEETVRAARFKDAYLRSRAQEGSAQEIHCGAERFQILGPLGKGTSSDVFLGQRLGPLGERVTLKLARPQTEPGRLSREADILRQITGSGTSDSDYLALHLPKPLSVGVSLGPVGKGQEVMVLRHPTGCWGSIADVSATHPGGLDPRHAVWMWRRILDVLSLVHERGWVHGDLAPEHVLVQPQDHGCLVIGWSCGQRRIETPSDPLSHPTRTRDLAQAAWSIRELLCGAGDIANLPASVPGPLAALLTRCCEDLAWLTTEDARSLDRSLKDASLKAFGPPTFIPFIPEAGVAGHQP